MRISAVIPCHDAAPYVAQALASIGAQTRPVDEIVLVDDGSRDASADVARAAAPMPLVVVSLPGRGPSAARNAGVAAAGGDVIAFLDADDAWHPEHLARGAALLGDGPDVLFASARDTLDARGRITPPRPRSIGEPTRGLGARDFTRLWYEAQDLMTSSFLVRAHALRAVGGFDENLRRAEDLDLCLRLLDGSTWCYDPRASILYRRGTPGSLTADRIATGLDGLRCWRKNLARYPWQKAQVQRNARALVRLALRSDDPEGFWRRHAALVLPLLGPRDRALAEVARRVPGVAGQAVRWRDDLAKRARPWQREVWGRVKGRPGAPRRDELLHAIARGACGLDGLRVRRVLQMDAAALTRARVEVAGGGVPSWWRALAPDATEASLVGAGADGDAGLAGASSKTSRQPEVLVLVCVAGAAGARVDVDGERLELVDGGVYFVNPGCAAEVVGASSSFVGVVLRGPLTRAAAGTLFFGEDVPAGFAAAPAMAATPSRVVTSRSWRRRVQDDWRWARHLAGGDWTWAKAGGDGDDDDE